MRDRAADLGKVAIAYVVGFVAACISAWLTARAGYDSVIVQLAVADVVATVVVFGFSVRHANSSVYDAYWSVIPIWVVGYLAWIGWAQSEAPLRIVLVVGLVGAWGVRLTHNWARGWSGFDHEDWRYREIQAKTGALYWPISLLGIHLFPTVLVFLGCLPMFAIMLEPGRALGWLDAVATLVTLGAIAIELLADNQLRDYTLHRKRAGFHAPLGPARYVVSSTGPTPGAGRETMTEGIWAWSRHPNYLGEIGFWWGIWLFGVAAVGGDRWSMISGAVAITCLFNFISIPILENRMLARRSDYRSVRARVSRLLPWPPKP